MDRTATIRASVHEVQFTLLISIGLVILVVFVFLRDPRATFIPSIAVPLSLAYAAINPAVGLGTFLAQLVLRRPLIANTPSCQTLGCISRPWAPSSPPC